MVKITQCQPVAAHSSQAQDFSDDAWDPSLGGRQACLTVRRLPRSRGPLNARQLDGSIK